jgi:5,10-methylenetetrahydromethanopterin reductase
MSRARIGLSVPPQLAPAGLPAYARRAESAGFDELWLAEDCFFAGGIAAVSAALSSTHRLAVGLGIMPAVARNAAFTAMEIAALAKLYPARLIVGLGHGMADWMRQIGAYPRSPLTALAEYLQAIRALLAGEPVSVAGDYVRLDGVRLDYPPAHVPRCWLACADHARWSYRAGWPTARSSPGRSPAPTSPRPAKRSSKDG